MAQALRDPRETRDRQIKKLIEAHEKNTHSAASAEKRKEIEKFVTEKVMPQTIYEKR